MENIFNSIGNNVSKYCNSFSNILGILGGACVYLLGGWDKFIMALLILMCLDYFTGILKAIYNKELSSRTGMNGIVKKIFILVIVAVAVCCEKIGIPAMREMAIMFFAANEGLSILENASATGLPIPDAIKNLLLQVRESKGAKSHE